MLPPSSPKLTTTVDRLSACFWKGKLARWPKGEFVGNTMLTRSASISNGVLVYLDTVYFNIINMEGARILCCVKCNFQKLCSGNSFPQAQTSGLNYQLSKSSTAKSVAFCLDLTAGCYRQRSKLRLEIGIDAMQACDTRRAWLTHLSSICCTFSSRSGRMGFSRSRTLDPSMHVISEALVDRIQPRNIESASILPSFVPTA